MRERKIALANKQVSISCVVPVHDEQSVIIEFLQALSSELEKLTNDYEIIVVDDGSKDDSLKLITEYRGNNIKVLSFSRNFGKELALTAGIEHCSKDVTILIDCDFQHPFTTIPEFLQKWAEGYDMVYAVRRNRKDESLLKRGFTKLFYRLLGIINEIDIPPNAGDFRLLDRKVIDSLTHFEECNRFMKGIYAWVGFSSIAIPYDVVERKHGTSKWSLLKLFGLALNGIFSFSTIPLRVWSMIGSLISLIAFIYGAYIIFDTLVFGIDIPGYATIVVAIMFFGGIQLLSIGILGEYIGRIFTEVKRRPKYIIKQKLGFDD